MKAVKNITALLMISTQLAAGIVSFLHFRSHAHDFDGYHIYQQRTVASPIKGIVQGLQKKCVESVVEGSSCGLLTLFSMKKLLQYYNHGCFLHDTTRGSLSLRTIVFPIDAIALIVAPKTSPPAFYI